MKNGEFENGEKVYVDEMLMSCGVCKRGFASDETSTCIGLTIEEDVCDDFGNCLFGPPPETEEEQVVLQEET